MSELRGDIAIIGMSCLYPGAASLRQFWENILHKVDAISDAPEDWHAELFYDPNSERGDQSYTNRGGFLKELAEFDPLDFGIMPHSVDGSSPDHFLAMRTAYDAVVDAGYADPEKLRPFQERTSVVLGHGAYINRAHGAVIQRWVSVDATIRVLKQLHPEHTDEDLALLREKLCASLPLLNTDNLPGMVPNVVSGRIANRLNLMGGTFNVDGACASSLLAVDIACRELLSGRSDMVVTGGVHASSTSPILIIFSQMKGLSRKGQIRPFDSDADGTLLSEGAGCLVLKRRADAERDHDRIYALIKGMGISSDGRALGLLAPRLEGEELAIRRAYANADIDPATIELIEGHGTATMVGDATELDALNHIFGARTGSLPRCALGSVKSMIGHSIPASGMASIIKMALALHHKVLPPTINCENPSPKLQAETSNLYINTETRPWIHGSEETPRRAAVNAFGFGGVNAHAVMEEFTSAAPDKLLHHLWDSELFVLTAADSAGLLAETGRLAKFVSDFPAELCMKDLACSLNTKPFAEARLAIVATSREDLLSKLQRAAGRLADAGLRNIRDQHGIYYFRQPLAAEGKLAFVFPGEGAQYMNMLVDLALHFPEVRETFDLMDRAYLDHPRGYLPSELLSPVPSYNSAERLWTMDVGTEAVSCANLSMFQLLNNLGLRPAMMMGHSTGEYSALRCAGAVELADDGEFIFRVRALNTIFEKLKAGAELPECSLLAIGGADRQRLESMVAASHGRLYLAIDNCPNQVVLCGGSNAIEGVIRELSSTPAICQKLPFSRAYHSPWFRVFSDHLQEFFEGLRIGTPRVPLYSCMTAEPLPPDSVEIRRIAASGWSNTVRFRETVERMYEDGARMFVEVGPRGNLKSFIDDVLRGKTYWAMPSNLQHRSGILQLQHLLGQLAAHGVPLNLEHLYKRRDPRPVEVPEKGRPKKRLRLGIEPMTLPPDFKLPSRTPVAERAPAAIKAPETPRPYVAPNVAPIPAAATVAAPVVNGHASAKIYDAPPVPVAIPQPASGRAAVLQQHFATMQQFLEVQQRIMGTVLTGQPAAPAPAALPTVAAPVPMVAASAPTVAPAASAAQRRLPFITEVLELVPGVRARSIYRVQSEPIFQDHALGQNVSEEDPGLNGVEIIPLTVSVEILAEAAAVLEPGKVVVEMRNMRSQRWVMLVPPIPVLEMIAEQVEPNVVRVIMREAAEGKPIRPVWMETTVVFAESYPPAERPTPLQLQDSKPSKWVDEDAMYPWAMFHGPKLRGVTRVDHCGTNGAIATLEILPQHELMKGWPDLQFLIDPVTMDAIGQVSGFWSMERIDINGDVFPYHFERMKCFGPMPPVGTRLEGRVTIHELSARDLRCDLEVLDAAGSVFFRVEDWTDRRFPQSRTVLDFRICPRDVVLSREAPGLVGGDSNSVYCSVLDGFEPGFLEASFGIWGKMMAGLVLSRSEREVWYNLGAGDREAWMLGRMAAKDAVRVFIDRRFSQKLFPTDITLIEDTPGQFRASGNWTTRLGVHPLVSITTCDGMAAAAVSLDRNRPPVIDAERIRKFRSQATQ